MIYDCLSFYNELDLLEIRLHELDPYVDKFVIGECDKTITGQPKKLFFQENMNNEVFKPFLPKINYAVFKFSDEHLTYNLSNEMAIVGSIGAIGLQNCQNDDIIMMSMGDEIPRGTAVQELKQTIEKNNFDDKTYCFNQIKVRHYINSLHEAENPWPGTRAATFQTMKNIGGMYALRHDPINEEINNGGWHYCFVGGLDRIMDKVSTYRHSELFGGFADVEKSKRILENNGDILARTENQILFPKPLTDPSVYPPKYIMDNLEKFKYLIKEV